jgi:hypothetical protein
MVLSLFLVSGYCDSAANPQAMATQQGADTLGNLIKKYLIGYWVQIRDVRDEPMWFGNLNTIRYPQHWAYICGAGTDYVALCSPSGMFYSAIPTSDIRLGGLYSDPRISVDICKLGYSCSLPR